MSKSPIVRVVPLAAVLLLALSCSPLVRLQVAFTLPAGLRPDPTRLRVTVSQVCDSHNQREARATTAPPAPDPGPGSERGARLEDGRLVYQAQGRSFRCVFQLAAWYDANGNNEVDAGDAVGRTSRAVVAEDRGLCAGNLTQAPDMVLERVP